jgi:hypothetical protein
MWTPNDVVHVVQESALHAAQTVHATRSIAVCCGQPKTPITLHQVEKAQVGKSVLAIARVFAKVMLKLISRIPGTTPELPRDDSSRELVVPTGVRDLSESPSVGSWEYLGIKSLRFPRRQVTGKTGDAS